MKYISTRGQAPALNFEQVLLTGLASDGGLYVPESWPGFAKDEIAALRGLSYVETAVAVMRPFVAGFTTVADHSRLCLAYPARHEAGARMFTKARAIHRVAIAEVAFLLGFAWSGRLISPISSRKIVPPSASSTRPNFCLSAPVNAPFS